MRIEEIISELEKIYRANRSVPRPYHILFFILYFFLSVFAFLSNLLLLVSLCRHHKKSRDCRNASNTNVCNHIHRIRKRRTPDESRDLLIGYLATFDLLLSVTMPLTALDVLSNYWPLGPNSELLAKLTRATPSAAVYSSSMTIILIALNCYRQILHSSEWQLNPRKIQFIMILTILISAIISIPIFHFTKLEPLVDDKLKILLERVDPILLNTNESSQTIQTEKTSPLREEISINNDKNSNNKRNVEQFFDITFLVDEWPNSWAGNTRLYYSIFSMLSQLVIPFFVISFCYYSVYKRLQRQANIQKRVLNTEERIRKENNRNKRRNKVLLTISLVYLFTWLPLGIFGALADANVEVFINNPDTTTIIFMLCHLIGMSSSCANPIIYGFRNKHLRNESVKLFRNTSKPILNLFQGSLSGSSMDAVAQHQNSDSTDNRKPLTAGESLPESRVISIALNTDTNESNLKFHPKIQKNLSEKSFREISQSNIIFTVNEFEAQSDYKHATQSVV